jgi:ATP-dependent DNA helicase RecQ
MILERQLQSYFGFDTFKKGQKAVVQHVLGQQSAAAIFPTGAGKSICYQLPSVLMPKMTLVVSPLLSIMKDQLAFLRTKNIPAARLDSTLSREEYHQIIEEAKSNKLKILMISVERLKNERFRNHLTQMQVGLLVVDEAHCISEWGHNFRPEYLKLPDYRREFNIPTVLLLTATATTKVCRDMCEKFDISSENVISTGSYRENLFLQVSPAQETEKKRLLLTRIKESPDSSTIVYVTLQRTAEEVARFLVDNKVEASAYHAGMRDEDRENIQNSFMAGELHSVVATIAFGMGIDKENIRRVIHYNMPKSIENYSQEIGRSGRDGKSAFCEVLANRDNINILENFVYGDTPTEDSIYSLLEEIKQQNGMEWHLALIALSRRLDIKTLPMKTLLIYLDKEGIIRPKYSYFKTYCFKHNESKEQIIGQFNGERQHFVKTIFDFCDTKKVWIYLNVDGVVKHLGCKRQRVIAAIEYFNEKNWVELQSKQVTEVYEILSKSYDSSKLGKRIFKIFKDKEADEINRINSMLDLFESHTCISNRLAKYFGDQLKEKRCGHCSVCHGSKAEIKHTTDLKSLTDFSPKELVSAFKRQAGNNYSTLNATKFLCGISSPVLSALKVKSISNYSVLENYQFMKVFRWLGASSSK